MKKLIAVVCVMIMLITTACGSADADSGNTDASSKIEASTSDTEIYTENTIQSEGPSGNILMADSSDGTDQTGDSTTSTVLGSDIPRNSVVSITVLNSLSEMPDDAWDVSEAGDGSVMAWTTMTDDNYYEVYIAGEGGVDANADCEFLFARYTEVQSIDLAYFDTSNCTNMSGMFLYCSALTELDLSMFDTAAVTDMNSMFLYCSDLQKLDISSFDTSGVTDMSSMFMSCSSLEELDLSSFDTSEVTTMYAMFQYDSHLQELDLSNFETSNVTSMRAMFRDCSRLQKLDLSNFDVSNVSEMTFIFTGCESLEDVITTDWDTTELW